MKMLICAGIVTNKSSPMCTWIYFAGSILNSAKRLYPFVSAALSCWKISLGIGNSSEKL